MSDGYGIYRLLRYLDAEHAEKGSRRIPWVPAVIGAIVVLGGVTWMLMTTLHQLSASLLGR
jgi:hypothetical protein